MHAGLNQWNWDEPEEDEGDEDGEWEEADAEEHAIGHTTSRTGLSKSKSEGGFSEDSDEDEDEAEADEACELGPCQLRDAPHVDPTIGSSCREGVRDWLFRAVAPVAGIIGVVLALWLGKPVIGRRGLIDDCNLPSWGQHQIQVSSTSSLNQRGSRGRRWLSLF
ncbi:hypothetical protein V6N13_047111 [Hibiscus sabdariffa]